jgi:RNA polymerase sigma-70 factor (ECF subfamily)
MAQSERLSASARTKLIILMPRLRRFATLLAGDRENADSLLRSACKKILDKGHTFQQGTAFDLRAFTELHGEWLSGLRSHEAPISQGQGDSSAFEPAVPDNGDNHFPEIAEILAHMPPQQRGAVLLVCGEGFSYDEAARIVDTPLQTVIARVSRALASFIERADWIDSAGLYGSKVEQLKQINRQAG